MNAFRNGLEEGGVPGGEMDDTEREMLALEIKAERGYWTALSNDMYRNVLPLRDTDQFDAARDAMLSRIELWVNKGLRRIHELGQLYAKLNGLQEWIYSGDKKHCESCDYAQGQVHRAREWLKIITPKSTQCICGGYRCGCTLSPTDKPPSGSLLAIPLASIKSHENHVHLPIESKSVSEGVAV